MADIMADENYDSDDDQIGDEAPVEEWDTKDVAKWLEKEGFGDLSERFVRHRIDGSLLYNLDDEDLYQVGVKRVGVRVKLLMTIQNHSMRDVRFRATTLMEPSWTSACLQFFTFKWAQTSEGKTGNEAKEEISGTSLALSVVSSLLTAICYSWFMDASSDCFCLKGGTNLDCYCSTGFDMDNQPLRAFFFFSGLAGVLFLCGTIVCVLQIIAINEMSDEVEIVLFCDKFEHETLPGQLCASGLAAMFCACFVYSFNTSRLGALSPDSHYTAKGLITLSTITIAYTYYATAKMIKNVYQAKLIASERHMEEQKQKAQERLKLAANVKRGALTTNQLDNLRVEVRDALNQGK